MTNKNQTLMEGLGPLTSERHLVRGEHLLRQGEHCQRLFFVRRGLLKAGYTTFEGRELVKSFIREGQYIASMHSILANEPSPFDVIALEPCELLAVDGGELQALAERDHAFALALNRLFMELAMKKEKREYEFLCLSAERRYRRFCDSEPELLGRLSQADVARYLGITPVALSRIRARRDTKKAAD